MSWEPISRMVSLLNKYLSHIEIKARVVWPIVGHFHEDHSFPYLLTCLPSSPLPPNSSPFCYIPLTYFPRSALPLHFLILRFKNIPLTLPTLLPTILPTYFLLSTYILRLGRIGVPLLFRGIRRQVGAPSGWLAVEVADGASVECPRFHRAAAVTAVREECCMDGAHRGSIIYFMRCALHHATYGQVLLQREHIQPSIASGSYLHRQN